MLWTCTFLVMNSEYFTEVIAVIAAGKRRGPYELCSVASETQWSCYNSRTGHIPFFDSQITFGLIVSSQCYKKKIEVRRKYMVVFDGGQRGLPRPLKCQGGLVLWLGILCSLTLAAVWGTHWTFQEQQ